MLSKKKKYYRKKIMYMMYIDWNWIFQRPHILALQLEQDFDVTVVYSRKILRVKPCQNQSRHPQKSIIIWRLPFDNKVKFFHLFENIQYRITMVNANKYDYILIGRPELVKYVPRYFCGKIIYDCMDDYALMQKNDKERKYINNCEKKMIKRADYIFASSNVLFRKLAQSTAEEQMYLVRNGYLGEKIYEPIHNTALNKKCVKLCYVGTVASWIDFDLLDALMNRFSELEVYFIGPVVTTIKKNNKIKFLGVKEHKDLYNCIKEMDCLIMPFVKNEIIEAVDPVKLYEYISWGKCIISVYYDEIKRFEPYVYFYNSENEIIELYQELKKQFFHPKYDSENQQAFLEDNTWNARYEQIVGILGEDQDENCYNN